MGGFGIWELIILLGIGAMTFGIPLLAVVMLIIYLKRGSAEKRRLRMKVSHLAEEVSLARQAKEEEEPS
jgi:hypothetical protein